MPAKKDLPRTNGRSVPPDLWIRPSAVAICCKIKRSKLVEHKESFLNFPFLKYKFGGQVRSQNGEWFPPTAQNTHRSVCTHHIKAIQVVHVTVLPLPVLGILHHRDLWSVKDGRLIHVIPHIQIILGTLLLQTN